MRKWILLILIIGLLGIHLKAQSIDYNRGVTTTLRGTILQIISIPPIINVEMVVVENGVPVRWQLEWQGPGKRISSFKPGDSALALMNPAQSIPKRGLLQSLVTLEGPQTIAKVDPPGSIQDILEAATLLGITSIILIHDDASSSK